MAKYTISDSFHAKKNIPIWLVKPTERLDMADFKRLESSIKTIGGYYSRFVRAFVFEKEPNETQLNEAFDETQAPTSTVSSNELVAKIPMSEKYAPVDKRTLRSEYEKGKLLVAAASYFDGMYDTERSIPDSEMVWTDKNAGFERELDYSSSRAYVSGKTIKIGYYEAKYKPDVKPLVLAAPIKQKSINFYIDVDAEGTNRSNDSDFFTLEQPIDSATNKNISNGTRVVMALYGKKFCGKVVDKKVSKYTTSMWTYGSNEKKFEEHEDVNYTVSLDNGILQTYANFKIADQDDCNQEVVPAIEKDGNLMFPDAFWNEYIVRLIKNINSRKRTMAARKNKNYAAQDQRAILEYSDMLHNNMLKWTNWEMQNLKSAISVTKETPEEQKYRMEKWQTEFNIKPVFLKKSIQQKLIELNNLI